MEKAIIRNDVNLVMIGGSAGSLEVIIDIMPVLHREMSAALVIVLHRKPSESILPDLLASKTALEVVEVEEKIQIRPATIYIAPPDYHLLIEKTQQFSLDFSEKVNFSRPSIDVSFESAADVFGNKLAGVLLSGANADGKEGLAAIRKAGGVSIAQDPKEASVEYMPLHAINNNAAEFVLNLEQMKKWFAGL